jgi:hypothetical protein
VLLKRGCLKAEQYFEKLIEMNENNVIHPTESEEAKQMRCRIFHRMMSEFDIKDKQTTVHYSV